MHTHTQTTGHTKSQAAGLYSAFPMSDSSTSTIVALRYPSVLFLLTDVRTRRYRMLHSASLAAAAHGSDTGVRPTVPTVVDVPA